MGLLSNEDRRTCIGAACRLGFGQGVLQGVLASEDAYKARWVESEWKGADQGKIEITSGAHSSDPEFDRALKTTQDYRWYDVSAKMDEEFDNKDKTLVLQYSVRHEQKIDCGGGYIKILPDGLDQKKFGGDSEYNIMFGPDICGTGTRKTHVIFTYKGKNLTEERRAGICQRENSFYVDT